MTFSKGTSAAKKEQITQILGVKVVDKHDRYLGMPAVVGKSKREIFSVLRDRIWKRINGWGEKTLSGAGREVLIKAVLQSVPNYIMSCFELPLYLIRSMESAIMRFWWGGGSKKKMAWTSWADLCRPKRLGGLGFRDLRAFNLALLAKQSWRLLIFPESLLCKVFKARYFPNSNFMEAQLGTRPSATWRGIINARVFLSRGIRMRIGNGHATRIWGSSWIPDDGRFTVFTPQPLHSLFPDRVADLIDPITRTWRVDLVNATFWPVDRSRILAIPVGAVEAEDRLVWHFSRDGKFSVKSCYHLINNVSHGAVAISSPSGSGAMARNWNFIWQLTLPPKIRMFIWRACSNILPTKVALFRRHIVANLICERCGLAVEFLVHSLFVCRDFQAIWRGEPFQLGPLEPQSSMWAVLELLKKSLSPETFLDAVVLCWKIWELRNKELHGSFDDLPRDIVAWAREYRASYLAAQSGVSMDSDPPLDVQWRPPDQDYIKINVDVALPVGQEFFRIGMVARDSNGVVLWWRVKQVAGRPNPTDGEAVAVLHGILLARDNAWPHVIVETDCLQVFRSLSSPSSSRSLSSFGALCDACLDCRPFFQSLLFSFVRRSGNSLAHSLATALVGSCNEGSSLPSGFD